MESIETRCGEDGSKDQGDENNSQGYATALKRPKIKAQGEMLQP